MSLKHKTVSGLLWSFVDDLAKYGITFVSGIILARLLTPREYGLMGMTTVFLAISQSFINSGFQQALIRKQDCTQADFSTVFYFNLTASVVFYLLLFLVAPAIARFFDQPQLQSIIRVLGLGLMVTAFGIVQQTKLTRALDFRLQTRISLISSALSGAAGICMAYAGYGVWSLVTSSLTASFVWLVLLWLWNDWRPSLVFSLESLQRMFSFGSRLLISGLIDTIWRNGYNLVIAKYFSAAELGYYTRATSFTDFPSQHLTRVIQRVSYPVLSTLQDDVSRLKAAYRRVIQNTMLVAFALMLGIAAVAEPMVIVLLGDQWRPSIIYLRLLCFVGMFYPLHAINLNMLQVLGRSDLFLRLEIIKKVLAVPVIVIGVVLGIEAMIVAMFANTLVAYYLNSYWSGKFIGYPSQQQIGDILPSFLLSASVGLMVYLFGSILVVPNLLKLVLQVGLGAVLTVSFAELLRMDSYRYVKSLALEKIASMVKPVRVEERNG